MEKGVYLCVGKNNTAVELITPVNKKWIDFIPISSLCWKSQFTLIIAVQPLQAVIYYCTTVVLVPIVMQYDSILCMRI